MKAMNHELIKYLYSHYCVSIFELAFTEVPKSFFQPKKLFGIFKLFYFNFTAIKLW